MDSLSWQQFQALWKLKMRLMWRFWAQRDQLYRWTVLLSFLLSGALALALGAGVSFLVYLPAVSESSIKISGEFLQYLWLGLFMIVSFIWLISPLMFVMKNESLTLDISRLTRYPIAYQTLHSFHSVLALLEPWTLFFYPMLLGLWLAVWGWQQPLLILPAAALLLLWLAVHLFWSRLLQDVMTLLFNSRFLREFFSLALLLLVILISFLPALISERSSIEQLRGIHAPSLELFLFQWSTWRMLQTPMNLLLAFTPAGQLAHGLSGLYINNWRWWLEACLCLLAWAALAHLLGVELLRRLFTNPPAVSSVRSKGWKWLEGLQLPLPYQMRVLILKELRTYFRSLLGKLSFFLTPLLVVILRVVGLGSTTMVPPESLLLGMCLYIFMTSLFLYINFFGSDGEGFKLYLLSAAPFRRLLIAKNVALALFASGQFALVLVLFVGFYRQTGAQLIFFGLCSFLSLLLGVLTMGNILSVRFPVAMDLNQTQYRQSNGTPVMLALQILVMLGGICGLPLWFAQQQQEPLWLLAAFLTLLLGLTWWLLLGYASQLLAENRWLILDKVTHEE